MLILGFILLGCWLYLAWIMLDFLTSYQLSARTQTLAPLSHHPRLSVIVTAKNEAAKIAHCLQSLSQLNYANLEIIVVNDRSTDATGNIIEQQAALDQRMRAIHIQTLPDGWLGKVHAMHIAAQQATGDYLLFTDGDVIFEIEALERAMRYIMHQQIAHLCLVPRMIAGDLWENTLMNFSGMLFLMGIVPQSVSSATSKTYAGIGAFNLITQTAYQQLGGYEALRLEIVDDMNLGRLVKQTGGRSELLIADDLLSVKWHTGLMGIIHGLEKNAFAAIDFSIVKLLIVTLILKTLIFLPYLAIWTHPFIYGLILMVMHGVYGFCCAKFHTDSWKMTWTLPLGAAFTLYALWNSAIVTLWQGGVKWRDTFYPLPLLKAFKIAQQQKQQG